MQKQKASFLRGSGRLNMLVFFFAKVMSLVGKEMKKVREKKKVYSS